MSTTNFSVTTSYSSDSRRVWYHIRVEDRRSHNDFLRDVRGRALRFSSKVNAEKRAVELLSAAPEASSHG